MTMTACVPAAHGVGVANEERSDAPLDAEVNGLASGFVPQIAPAPLRLSADLIVLYYTKRTRIANEGLRITG